MLLRRIIPPALALLAGLLGAAGASGQTPTADAYRPITAQERRNFYWRTNFASKRAVLMPLFRASLNHLEDEPPDWDEDLEAFAQRGAAKFAEGLTRRSTEAAVAAALGHDPRYIRKGEGYRVWSRVRHALTSQVLTYDRNGGRVFAAGRVAGNYAGPMAALAWLPERYSWKDGVREGTQKFIFRSGMSLLREFSPEIKGLISRNDKSKPSDPDKK